jgi:hypothetical protein
LESRPHRAAHPDRPSCDAFRTTVEPAGTQNRTSRDQRGKRTGFWHTVQFSRCERRPEGKGLQRDGVARPTMVGTRPGGVNRTPAGPDASAVPSHHTSRSSNGRSSGNGRIPVWRERAGRVYVRSSPLILHRRRTNPRRPTWSTRPRSCATGSSSSSSVMARPSSLTPPCSISFRAREFESARPRATISLGR